MRLTPHMCSISTHTQVNVEYNQLDPLLRATINPEGDVNDPKTGAQGGAQSLHPQCAQIAIKAHG